MAIIEDNHYHQQQQQPKASPDSSSPPPESQYVLLKLPTEIIVEILLKLPVESLLRCKSVCKSWCSLISDPYFVTSHLNLSAHNNKRLIISVWGSNILNTCFLNDVMNDSFIDNAFEVVDYPLKSAGKRVSVVGSCNGLLCLHISTQNDGDRYDILIIWNPSTRKYHKLPSYAFRTDVTRNFFGFGYDDSTDDYKVVSMSFKCYKGRIDTFIKMYSLRNGSWKDIGVFPHGMPRDPFKFVNGALHWLASYDDAHRKIISLDLATETFGEVMLPVFDQGKRQLLLGSLGEWLCVVCEYDQIRVDLWAMKAYGVKDSWTKVFSVPYMPDHQMIDGFLMPLFVSDNGRILLTFGKQLMIYDSKNNSFPDVQYFDDWVLASTFDESLVSPRPPAAAPGHGLQTQHQN